MIYCISDIHGCFEEFTELLSKIKFKDSDTLYILGDIIDRGDKIFECTELVKNAHNIKFVRGNHEQMMIDYYQNGESRWDRNGGPYTREQAARYFNNEQALNNFILYLDSLPLYEILENINGNNFFLSHAGLDSSKSIENQNPNDLLWSREKFYLNKGLEGYLCIFGHTPTSHIDFSEKGVWKDKYFNDKINIDCGCVYGGSLCAICLEDLSVNYVQHKD